MDEPNVKVKSLAKALNVLNCFIQEPELGVTEISERLGLYKSNVCDILTTFQSLGYVDQSERTGKYHLGYRILELSHAFTTSMGFRKTIYPHMKQLADKVGETVYLGVPDGLDVLYLDAAYPGHEYMTRAMLGDRVEIGCNSVLNPGTVIGPDSNVYPTSCVRGVIPANHVYKDAAHIVEKK